MSAPSSLTPKQQEFAEQYLVDLNATQAAIRAGYSKKTAEQQGARLLTNVKVAEAIRAAQAARSQRTGITADAVLERLWMIATADPREPVEYRRTCCRYCYGKDFEHQYTVQELKRARADWDAIQQRRLREKDKDGNPVAVEPAVFDEQGGVGYNATRDPNPECPQCFGQGHERMYANDTRHLSPSALLLYAGVKTTKDGLEVKMYDRKDTLIDVGKHCGLFTEKHEHNITGAGVLAVPVPLSDEQWAAGAIAQQTALLASRRPADAPT